MRNAAREKGSAILEFTLIGIPMIFLLISTFEMARGMWMYHSLAHALKDGIRLAIVHGENCGVAPNSCQVRIQDIAQRVRDSGVGLIPEDVRNVTFRSTTRTITCSTLQDCLTGSAGSTYWPAAAPGLPRDAGSQRGLDIEITASYRFRSALAMFWPGAGTVAFAGELWFPGSSKERIQY